MRNVLMKDCYIFVSLSPSSELIFIASLEGMCPRSCFYAFFIRDIDLDGQGPFLRDFILK